VNGYKRKNAPLDQTAGGDEHVKDIAFKHGMKKGKGGGKEEVRVDRTRIRFHRKRRPMK